jgi:hypothetical protein
MKKPIPVPTDRIMEAALSNRSELYRWMVRNFRELDDTISNAGRPNWQALAETFGSLGLTDFTGKAPTKEGARQTWWKVKKAAAKAAEATPPAPLAASHPTQGALPPARLPLPNHARPAVVSTREDSSVTIDRPTPPPRTKLAFKGSQPAEPGSAWKDDGSSLPKPILPSKS